MYESNVYNLYKPPCLPIVASLSGCPSTSDLLYQTEFLSDSNFQCSPQPTQISLSDVFRVHTGLKS